MTCKTNSKQCFCWEMCRAGSQAFAGDRLIIISGDLALDKGYKI